MTTTVSRLFDTYDHAKDAVAQVEAAGVPHDDISIVASNADESHGPVATDMTGAAPGAGTGATVGTVLGGGAGLLAGLGMLAIPGVGPVVAAGWLIATVTGAGAGALGGGLLGSLVGSGVDESEAHVYAEGVRRGGTLVTVRAADDKAGAVQGILDANAVNTTERDALYRAEGWSKFDEAAPAYRSDMQTGRTPLV